MHFLENYYKKIIKKDLLNKFKYSNTNEFAKFKKIILHLGLKHNNIRKIAINKLTLELLTKRKSNLTFSKKPNLFLKIQKGHPVGCKIILTKKTMYMFIERLLTEIFPKIKSFQNLKIKIQNNNFSFKINCNNIKIKELEEQYPLFTNLPYLSIHIETNTKTKKELLFLIKSFKFPINF
jgi:ribosomal protein L5